VAVGRRAE
jgi:hypothetical protein